MTIADPQSFLYAKTPGTQGVIIDDPVLTAIIIELMKAMPKGRPMFGTDATRYRRWWW